MPTLKQHIVFEAARGVKAFLSFETGLVRGEAPVSERNGRGPRRELDRLRKQSENKDRRIEQLRGRLSDRDREIKELRQQFTDKDRELVEFKNGLEGGLPIPPPREIFLVSGSENVSAFLKSGEIHTGLIREMLGRNGLDIEDFDSMLDFGCGCGRMIRHWNDLEGPEVHGTDYNPDLISWCEKNLDFANFQTNELVGGLDYYEDGKFDFVYALSVFTHLTEPQQFFWIEELSRILRPGGHLFITTHGDFYRKRLSPEEEERFRGGRLVVRAEESAGENKCAAFHPEAYVRGNLAAGLSVVDLVRGAEGSVYAQDSWLLRKP